MAAEDSSKKVPSKFGHECTQPASTMNGSSRSTSPSPPNVLTHSTSASGTMKKKPLSAQAFARLALVESSDDLKPIRRPLPSDLTFCSDSEDTSIESSTPEPKGSSTYSPFFNSDESDSQMSSGLSPSPSPQYQTVRPSSPQPTTNIRPLPTMAHSPASAWDNEVLNIVPKYSPPRRGFVTPTTDFDALMHFAHSGPAPAQPQNKKRKRGNGQGKGEQKAERKEPGMNCSGTTDTPLMSWLRRAKEMGLRLGGGTAAAGNGGEGSSTAAGPTDSHSTHQGGTMGDSHSTGDSGTMGSAGVGHSTAGLGTMGRSGGRGRTKRAARRTRGVTRRAYTWKDPSKKNKSGLKDRMGEDKGKGKDDEGKGREE